jgi:hypothetical protein
MPIAIAYLGNGNLLFNKNRYAKREAGTATKQRVIVSVIDTSPGSSYRIELESNHYTWDPPGPHIVSLDPLLGVTLTVLANPTAFSGDSLNLLELIQDQLQVTVTNEDTNEQATLPAPQPIQVIDDALLKKLLKTSNDGQLAKLLNAKAPRSKGGGTPAKAPAAKPGGKKGAS